MIARDQLDLPLAVTQLMKGVVYRDTHDKAWQHLQGLLPQVRDYVATIGLDTVSQIAIDDDWSALRLKVV